MAREEAENDAGTRAAAIAAPSRFEVLAPDEVELVACNCSICRMTGFLHLIVTKERFRLLAGKAS